MQNYYIVPKNQLRYDFSQQPRSQGLSPSRIKTFPPSVVTHSIFELCNQFSRFTLAHTFSRIQLAQLLTRSSNSGQVYRDTCILCTFVREKNQLWLLPEYKVREVGAFDPHVYPSHKRCCSSWYEHAKVTSCERNDKLAHTELTWSVQSTLSLSQHLQVSMNVLVIFHIFALVEKRHFQSCDEANRW